MYSALNFELCGDKIIKRSLEKPKVIEKDIDEFLQDLRFLKKKTELQYKSQRATWFAWRIWKIRN